MAITGGEGLSRIIKNRRYEDYRSMKQYFSDRTIQEVIISGTTTTDGAAVEVNFTNNGDTINYIAAEGQVYIRTEADDANQDGKYVYIEYQDDTGAVMPILTADLAAPDNTVEVIVTGASDFFRLRQMISEVEAASGGGKGIILTDANMGGADDVFGFIDDNNSQFNLERFFTQPSAICDSYLAYVHAHAGETGTDANNDSYILDVTFTPRPLTTTEGFAEPQVAADNTIPHDFMGELDWQPGIKLEGGTEVIFLVGDNDDPGHIFIEAVLLEVYPHNSTPSS